MLEPCFFITRINLIKILSHTDVCLFPLSIFFFIQLFVCVRCQFSKWNGCLFVLLSLLLFKHFFFFSVITTLTNLCFSLLLVIQLFVCFCRLYFLFYSCLFVSVYLKPYICLFVSVFTTISQKKLFVSFITTFIDNIGLLKSGDRQ